MKRIIRIALIILIVVAVSLLAKTAAFQTRNVIDVPVIFAFILIGALLVMWFNYLKKRDNDKGFM